MYNIFNDLYFIFGIMKTWKMFFKLIRLLNFLGTK